MATSQVFIEQHTLPIQHTPPVQYQRPPSQHQRPSSQHGPSQAGITSQTTQVNHTLPPTQITQTVTPISTSQVKDGEIIKGNQLNYLGHSRIEYVPFQNKIIDYETREWVEKVPVQRTVTEY
jgi:hypothetical protein